MSTNVRDLRDTIIPKSDQLNAEQLLAGPITVTVTDVRRGGGEDQPVVVHYDGEGGRPYKPCKSMRKVLVFAWGSDGSQWIGRSMTLYNRPDVKFGGEEVGGIRISHLSDIDKDIAISLTATRGRKEQTRVKRLEEGSTVKGSRSRLEAAARGGMDSLKSAWSAIPRDHQIAIGGTQGCPDELKQIALKVESPDDEAPRFTAQEVHDALANAKDRDSLDLAGDLIRMLPNDEQAPLFALYGTRQKEIEA
jgi:hypothetical protein